MRVAILGGIRLIGPFIVRDLAQQGHEVDVYHRGKTTCDLGQGVGHVTIDRKERARPPRLSPIMRHDDQSLSRCPHNARTVDDPGLSRPQVSLTSQR